ncbi:MAG: DUF5074 domain-containing protein [Bacteroidota bacterium]
MNHKQQIKASLVVACISCFFILMNACTKDKVDTIPQVYKSPGMFICNEGPFQSGSGTVDYYSLNDQQCQKDIFGSKNGLPLGNIVQSMLKVGDTIFVIVNNSNKVVVVKASDFSLIGSIESLVLPRFMISVSATKAYLSCWDNSVAIIDLKTLQVIGHIPVGTGPEKMLKSGNQVFVLNQGGFSNDSTVSVINTLTNQVEQTLAVYPRPSGIVEDQASGEIWILCSGIGFDGWPGANDSEGHLVSILKGTSYSILKDFPFPDKSFHPMKLVQNTVTGDLLYLYKQGVFSQKTNAPKLDTASFINLGIPFYSLGFVSWGSPALSYVVASDPVDYTQDGWVYLFHANDGKLADSVHAGVVPTDFIFLH